MIIEIADIRVRPEDKDTFAQVVAQAARDTIAKAEGYRSHTILSCVETPGRFILQVQWDTLEAHTVAFRGSPLFAEWRGQVGKFFAQPPQVEHFQTV